MPSDHDASAEPDAARQGSQDAPPTASSELSDLDQRILALESRTFRYVGSKERAIREEIGISKVGYYVRLNTLLDEPAALRAAPALVNRLRSQRTSEHGAVPARGADRVA
ncbi:MULTISPECIES: DUF3263 domain-containing protein [unclassified Brachybacterium]|uniref:DUF3263 domain-containing protein n=1 Tax=unclassified Brachybacterium TaxID=2623841 RepID=UPI003620D8EF